MKGWAIKRFLIAGLALASVAAAAWGVTAKAQPNVDRPNAMGDPVKGKAVYAYWCTACHGRGPGHPGSQSLEVKYSGQDVAAALEDRTDLSPEVTAYFVRNGFALMPPFRKTEISDAELRDLGAYLAKEE